MNASAGMSLRGKLMALSVATVAALVLLFALLAEQRKIAVDVGPPGEDTQSG